MNDSDLRQAFSELLDAAATVAGAGADGSIQPSGGWNADQILAHVTLVNAATIAAVSSVTTGTIATYDNRLTADAWTIDRVIGLAGGNLGLRERIRRQGDALCALVPTLTGTELDTLIPTLLISDKVVLVDRPLPLRDIITGLAQVELPGHAKQLLAIDAADQVSTQSTVYPRM
jgi:hypothetical protein